MIGDVMIFTALRSRRFWARGRNRDLLGAIRARASVKKPQARARDSKATPSACRPETRIADRVRRLAAAARHWIKQVVAGPSLAANRRDRCRLNVQPLRN